MFITFFREFTTQSKTAFNFGTLFMVLSGRNTLKTLKDFIVDRFWPAELPLQRNVGMNERPMIAAPCLVPRHTESYAPYIEAERYGGTDYYYCIHYVPKFPKIRSGMEYDSQVYNFENHFYREHTGEGIIEIVQYVIPDWSFLDGVFSGECYRAKTNNYHYENIEVL